MHKLHWLRVGVCTYLRFCHPVRYATDEEKNEELVVVVVDLVELESDSADLRSKEVVDHCDDQALY
jgi:hypothetical protein